MNPLSIAVFSDVICPWCLLGKRRLERALDGLGLRESTAIRWLPFELNPDMPAEGIERSAYRAAKFGAERSAALDAQITALGADEGVAFDFAAQKRTPNTRRAHMLVAQAEAVGLGDVAVEALFRAYFQEGRDVGSDDVLGEIAARIGLDREATLARLADPALDAQVGELEAQAGRIGIAGVPFFIVNETWALSGAQPAERWTAALQDLSAQIAEAERAQPAA